MRDEDLIEYHLKSQSKGGRRIRRRNWYKISYILSLLAWLAFVVYLMMVPAATEDFKQEHLDAKEILEDIKLESALAASDVNKPASEPVTYKSWFMENAERIDNCEITRYCCEAREHICGTGDGITSTGVPVTPDWTCAVDPTVIPYGSDVMVDYGDSVAFYKAQDCGGAIKGNHIDLAVDTHQRALEAGRTIATVYWMEDANGVN